MALASAGVCLPQQELGQEGRRDSSTSCRQQPKGRVRQPLMQPFTSSHKQTVHMLRLRAHCTGGFPLCRRVLPAAGQHLHG